MIAVVLGIALLASGCTSSGDDPDEAAVGESPDGTPVVLPTATVPPLPSPTPAIPDTGEGPIIVGALLAQSGIMSGRDLPALRAVRVQVGRLNDEGGLLGRPVELVEVDTESRLGVTVDATRDLLRRGVDMLIVSCDPVRAEPAIDEAVALGVLVLTPCGADPSWADTHELVFSFSTSSEHEGRVLAEWALDNGFASTMALIDRTNPDVESFCRAFLQHYRSLGGTVLFTDEFTFDSLDPFEDRLAQRPVNAQSVLLCSHLPGGLNGAPNIIELVRARGIRAPILAGSGVDGGPTWFNVVLDLGELVMVTPTSAYGDDPNPEVAELARIIDQDQPVPVARGWSVFGADLIVGWARAVERARSVDGRSVAQQLEQFDREPLLSSLVSFSPDNHMDADRDLRILVVVDRAVTLREVRTAR